MQHRVVRYGLAVVFVAAAYLLRQALNPLIGTRTPFVVLYFLPVIAAAWRCGTGPALVAAVLGVVVGDSVSFGPGSDVPLMARVARVSAFLLESWFLAWVVAARERESLARRESERRYRHLAENFPGGAVLMVDRDMRYVVADGLGLAEAGMSGAMMVGRTPREMYGAEDAQQTTARYAAALAGQSSVEELHYAGRAHMVRTVPMRDEAGAIVGAITVTQDVSEQRQLEQQLRETQKLQAVGRLAGGVAHDFNNLLAVISGSCELILLEAGRSRSLDQHVQAIDEAVTRASALTRQLLAFSRNQVLETELTDLNELLDELRPSLERMVGETIQLKFVLGGELGKVRVNRTQAERAVTNLCVNARDAMPAGGAIELCTRRVVVEQDSDERASIPPGDYVTLTVRDGGMGMDEHTRAHLFEPYFTTKGVGRGTGLGLSIVHGFVGHSQGHVRVSSVAGQGSEFALYLPVAEERAAPRLRSSRRISLPAGGRRILVVDDEDSIRDLICQLLEAQGFRVQGARDAESALAQVSAELALVVADLELPGMSGAQLCRALRQRFPEVPLLLISGGQLTVRGEELAGARWAFLPKPFGMSALSDQVEQLTSGVHPAERPSDEQLSPAG